MSITEFLKSESGAVTVDWVMLTAATVGLGIATTAAVRGGVGSLADSVEASLTNATVASLNFGATGHVDNYGEACGGTPEYPVMDCGVVWNFGDDVVWNDGIAGTIEVDGTSYFVNDQNVIVDESGNPGPLTVWLAQDADGNFVAGPTYDIAGRLVDDNGVPL